MKNFHISDEERNIILNLHESSTIKIKVFEQNVNSSSFDSKKSEVDNLVNNIKSTISRLSKQNTTEKVESNEQLTRLGAVEKYNLSNTIQQKLLSASESCGKINQYNALTVLSSDQSIRIENGIKIQDELKKILSDLGELNSAFRKMI